MLSGVSEVSGASHQTRKEEDRPTTCLDIKLILPTVIILVFTLLVMGTVIPYAFHTVIKQLQDVWELEEQSI